MIYDASTRVGREVVKKMYRNKAKAMGIEHIINPLLDQLGKEQEKQDIGVGDLDWEGPEEAELPRVFCLLTRTGKDPRRPSYHVDFILLTKSETERKTANRSRV